MCKTGRREPRGCRPCYLRAGSRMRPSPDFFWRPRSRSLPASRNTGCLRPRSPDCVCRSISFRGHPTTRARSFARGLFRRRVSPRDGPAPITSMRHPLLLVPSRCTTPHPAERLGGSAPSSSVVLSRQLSRGSRASDHRLHAPSALSPGSTTMAAIRVPRWRRGSPRSSAAWPGRAGVVGGTHHRPIRSAEAGTIGERFAEHVASR